ncbi:MAG TPA: uracil phosphoribosyltransferase [Acidimicrobiaceae bacterium]|nr:uracil phosphoribosyltransferase [Acidimicrobiaceae bacterium]
MEIVVVEHPLVAERLTELRRAATDHGGFRHNLQELSRLLVYEALHDLPVDTVAVDSALGPAPGIHVPNPPLLVPVLRAGLGMLEAALSILPASLVAFVGTRRVESAEPGADGTTTVGHEHYLNGLPADLAGRPALVLDPMLATGGSLAHVCALVAEYGASPVTAVCALAAPEGVAVLEEAGVVDRLVTASVDDGLDRNAFIVPGLGDAGDRLYGTA